MNKSKLFNFIIFIPFAISIGAFILYIRCLIMIKSVGVLKVTGLMEASLVRYRNIAIFCLAVGVFLLFIKTLIQYFRINDAVSSSDERILDRISSREVNKENKYSLNETSIINDLLNGKVLKAKFVNNKNKDMMVKFNNYDDKKNIIEFIDLSRKEEVKTVNEVVKKEVVKEEIKYDSRYFKKCYKCRNVIAKDSIICVHCGTVLKPNKIKKEKNSFNPVRFALNMIVILLCIILVLLCLNKISRQSKINRSNLNIDSIKERINR